MAHMAISSRPPDRTGEVAWGETDQEKIPLFKEYRTRQDACDDGVHRHNINGIVGNERKGCFSICLNSPNDPDGTYSNNDFGDWIIFSGMGGKDKFDTLKRVRRPTEDQSADRYGNAALFRSIETGEPVRVLRGANANTIWAPVTGFRYDGLYTVLESKEVNESGRLTFRFLLHRIPNQLKLQQRPRSKLNPPLPYKTWEEIEFEAKEKFANLPKWDSTLIPPRVPITIRRNSGNAKTLNGVRNVTWLPPKKGEGKTMVLDLVGVPTTFKPRVKVQDRNPRVKSEGYKPKVKLEDRKLNVKGEARTPKVKVEVVKMELD